MKIVIFGAPGAGKGTQAVKIAHTYGVTHISTGDILRKNIADKTPIGLEAKSYIDKGHLVPDEVVGKLLKDRLSQSDANGNFLLDGYPRTLPQVDVLASITDVDVVLALDVNPELIVKRVVNRMICSGCGKVFSKVNYDGTNCDECRGLLVHRADDNEEVVRERLRVYDEQTAPIADRYEKMGKLVKIDGSQDVDSVFESIKKVLDGIDQKR